MRQRISPVNEGNAKGIAFALKDPSGSAATPDSAKYRIDDPIAVRVIKGWTVIGSPTDTLLIEVTGEENSLDISGDGATDETREVTIVAMYGTEPFMDSALYQVEASPVYAFGD